jgi:hypothetical protein
MLDLERALTDIKTVRRQIALGTEFRGYGAAAFAITGILALVAAFAQATWIENPAADVFSYLGLWTTTAILSVTLIGVDVVTRSRRVHSGLSDAMIQSAVEQLLPAMIAGAMLTFVILRFAPEALWMLPGLWQVVLSLGIFASCRSLPAPFVVVGIWYLGSGLVCLALANEAHAFSPWAMGIPFGFGQLLSAALIHTVGAGDAEE